MPERFDLYGHPDYVPTEYQQTQREISERLSDILAPNIYDQSPIPYAPTHNPLQGKSWEEFQIGGAWEQYKGVILIGLGTLVFISLMKGRRR